MDEATTTKELADAFAEACESQAGWRSIKAVEYPEDARNARAADALSALADWARQNPAEVAAGLAGLPPSLTNASLGVLAFGEQAGRLMSRYAFGYEPEQPRLFLVRLAEASRQDAVSDQDDAGD